MSFVLILFIVVLILSGIFLYLDFKFHLAGSSFISIFPLVFLFLICLERKQTVAYEPVEYKAEVTTFKVFAITKDHIWESDKKKDFDEWTQNRPGFIEKHFNAFRVELPQHRAFTVQKPNTETK